MDDGEGRMEGEGERIREGRALWNSRRGKAWMGGGGSEKWGGGRRGCCPLLQIRFPSALRVGHSFPGLGFGSFPSGSIFGGRGVFFAECCLFKKKH